MAGSPPFPKWLPPTVKIEAERILCAFERDEALVVRLAIDERMRVVWRELAKHARGEARLRPAWRDLMAGRVDVAPPDDDDVLAGFFWCAYALASMGVTAGTVSIYNLPIARYNLVAAELRLSVARLRKLKAQFGEVVQGACQFADIHANQIEEAAQFCDDIADTLTKMKAHTVAAIVDRDYGNLEARGYVRMLAIEARHLFGQTLYRTLARVASVALAKDITGAQVRKWCESRD